MPTSVAAAVLLLAAMTPGFAFRQAFQRFSPTDTRSSTAEVVEMFSVGALSSFLGALIAFALAELIPFLVRLHVAAAGAGADLRHRPWSWVVSGVFALVVSVALSAMCGTYLGSRSAGRTGHGLREGIAAIRALTETSAAGTKPFLAIELTDGRLVEGFLRYVNVDADPGRRDVVLQSPMAWTGPGQEPRTRARAKLIVVPGSMVRVIHISYPSPPTTVTAPATP